MTRAGFLAAMAFVAASSLAGAAATLAQQAPAPGAARPAAAAQAPAADDPVVAMVNGDAVRASEIIYLYQTLGDQVRQLSFELLYPQLLQTSIERKLSAQKARAAQVDKRADVQQKTDFWRERVLEETLLNEAVEKGITDEAVQAAYAALVAGDASQEEISAKHMLFAEEADAIAAVKELDAGANFDQILDRVTAAGTGRGGPINYFRRDGIVAAFGEAAFRMRPGEYTTTAVRSEFGFHIIFVVDRRMAAPPPFNKIAADLRQQVSRELVDKFYADLVQGADVKKFNFDGTPMTP